MIKQVCQKLAFVIIGLKYWQWLKPIWTKWLKPMESIAVAMEHLQNVLPEYIFHSVLSDPISS